MVLGPAHLEHREQWRCMTCAPRCDIPIHRLPVLRSSHVTLSLVEDVRLCEGLSPRQPSNAFCGQYRAIEVRRTCDCRH